MVKNLPAMQETWVQSLGQKDPLEKGMATHSSVLAWRITWTEESVRLQSMGLQRVGHDLATNLPPPPKGTCPVLGSFLGTGDPAITNTVTDPCPHLEHQF